MKKLLIGGLLSCLMGSFSLSATQLAMTPGTMLLGGTASFNWSALDLSKVNSDTSKIGGEGTFNMQWSAVDNLFLGFNIGGGGGMEYMPLTNSFRKNTTHLMAGFSLDYYFSTGTVVYPYLGTDINAKIYLRDPVSFTGLLSPNVGIAVAVVDNVAVDFGINADLEFPISPTPNPYAVAFNAGALFAGIKAFF